MLDEGCQWFFRHHLFTSRRATRIWTTSFTKQAVFLGNVVTRNPNSSQTWHEAVQTSPRKWSILISGSLSKRKLNLRSRSDFGGDYLDCEELVDMRQICPKRRVLRISGQRQSRVDAYKLLIIGRDWFSWTFLTFRGCGCSFEGVLARSEQLFFRRSSIFHAIWKKKIKETK